VDVARRLLDSIRPDASLWAFHPVAAVDAVELVGHSPARDAYLDQLVDAVHDPEAAAGVLAARVRNAARAGRDEELARVYPILRSRFATTAAARSVTAFDPQKHVRPGRDLPDFDLPALVDAHTAPGTHVTRASLRGKVAIIDFWGTWCIPCRGEIKYLEQTYARHKAQGLAVVSVAVRDRLSAVRNMTKTMPWTHVVLDASNEDETLKLFENPMFPTAILVDPAGRILAMGEELRGTALERAVENALASGAAAHH
jgi:thiol-disulfide isomerase/thioredoxin